MMRKFAILIIGLLIATAFAGCIEHEEKEKIVPLEDLTKYVNPFIGTTNYGHTFPGAALPFGMVQLSPDTDTPAWDYCSGYLSRDDSIMGFSHTHLSGTGRSEFGNVLVMPTIGALKTVPGTRDDPDAGYRSRFSHDSEVAQPGYYAVTLDDYGIKAELTATTRAGFHRYTFPSASDAHILIDVSHRMNGRPNNDPADGEVTIIGNNQIEGHTHCNGSTGGWSFPTTIDTEDPIKTESTVYTIQDYTVYFVANFSEPFDSYGTWKDAVISKGNSHECGENVGAFVNYNTSESESILVKVGISFVSIEQARTNLESEILDWDFDKVKGETRQTWNLELNKVEVEGGREEHKVIFYTALYHALLCPYTFSDVDGKYIGMDGQLHTEENYTHYHVFSLWDTFRAEYPLLILIEPVRAKDMVKSLVDKYKQGGWIPKWELVNSYSSVMIGTHATSIIAEAHLKGILEGISKPDIDKAYEGMRKNAMESSTTPLYEARGGINYYKDIGYVPSDIVWESVSRTLEFAYDDYCLAQIAKALGENDDYDLFIDRSKNYENVFEPSEGFMRGRNEDGSWVTPFDPFVHTSDFTEGNSWQYSWFVPHDVYGLINLMGGREAFANKLDTLFTLPSKPIWPNIVGMIGQYAHGNEPSHHIPYLYDYSGQPWKTQEKVRQIMDEKYVTDRQGLCGNDDCGQLSAWYIFSAMGFYPVCPGEPSYEIGSPVFDEVIIHLDSKYYKNEKFVIKANSVSKENKYIQSATLNGKPLNKPWIKHSDIVNGGTLIFEMGPEPNKEWGCEPENAPPSMSLPA
jgi:predicted alpha-1,2-mannosidase